MPEEPVKIKFWQIELGTLGDVATAGASFVAGVIYDVNFAAGGLLAPFEMGLTFIAGGLAVKYGAQLIARASRSKRRSDNSD